MDNGQSPNQKETLKKTDPKSGDEMSNAKMAAELTLVMKDKRTQ